MGETGVRGVRVRRGATARGSRPSSSRRAAGFASSRARKTATTVCSTAGRRNIGIAYVPQKHQEAEATATATDARANSLDLLLKELNQVFQDVELADSGDVSLDALEKAREVADLAREASRLASAAASLESTMDLPSAPSSTERDGSSSDASSPVVGLTGEIRPLTESKEVLRTSRRRQRVRRARSARNARKRRWNSPQAQREDEEEALEILEAPAPPPAPPSSPEGTSDVLTVDEISGAGGDYSLQFDLLTAAEEQQLAVKVQELKQLEDCYFKAHGDLGKVPTMKEWAEYAGFGQDGERLQEAYSECLQAKQRMIGANIRLVQSVAKKYSGNGLEFTDLVQEGCLGLVRGAEKFDPSKGYKFSTYAHWWVRQSITRAIQDNGRDVRLPVHLHELMTKVRSVQAQLREDPGFLDKSQGKEKGSKTPKLRAKGKGKGKGGEDRAPSSGNSVYAKIAKHLDVEEDRVNKLCKLMEDPMSFEQRVSGESGKGGDSGSGGLTFEEILSDESQECPELFAYNERLQMDVKNLLDTLSERERKIIALRYGVLGNKQMTLETIGAEFSVTRERIRQIESRALRKLRDPERNGIVRDYQDSFPL
ncbi:RNA polymerase sigma factor SigA [Chloropicon primus]|uniref:RNA polymerase sigma factor SigA n=2 Tax=Chloropicon primus TaxID=1764295 RepID=A0A5B8MSF2_9CHLO|nr:RNA polymerase sigma factor SigA [Chloropicon primus]UPR02891.1 RNA polymerase sigma factor SigA [Chloropicon primus]|eukprot:QDZ23678.1 RNA polymerase sigma factor SigA [Chloropicon primus]